MIKYDPLWQTLKAKNISQYQLIKDYGIDKAQLQRLRQNMVVKRLFWGDGGLKVPSTPVFS